MEIIVDYKEDIAIVRLVGELDISTVDYFCNKLTTIKKDYSKMIFDFFKVEFVDSTALSRIIKLLKDEEEIRYAITHLQADMYEIMETLNLKEVLGEEVFIYTTEEAIKYLNR